MGTLFENIVNLVLLNEIKVHDKWKLEKENGKTNLDFPTYVRVCLLDPTTKDVGDDFLAGKYCNWLLHVIDIEKTKNRDENYEKKVKGALQVFNDGLRTGKLKCQGIDTNINSFKSVDDFVSAMENFASQERGLSVSLMDNMKKLEGQYEIVGESKNWLIVAPKTWEAERYFGGGTKWCTVANLNYFNSYMKDGQLYITLPKSMDNKLKMQFHFERNEFADFEDHVKKNPKICICKVLGEGESFDEVCDMWESINSDFSVYKFTKFSEIESKLASGAKVEDIADDFAYYQNGIVLIIIRDKYNFVNLKTNRLLSPKLWFDYVSIGYGENAVKVQISNKSNIFNFDLGLLWKKPVDEWFRYIYISNTDTYPICVAIENSDDCLLYNCINDTGKLLWNKPINEWSEKRFEFFGDYSLIKIHGKTNLIDKNGRLMWKKPVDEWFDFISGGRYHESHQYRHVRLGKKHNFLGLDGTLLWKKPLDEWFDYAGGFGEHGISDISIIEINGKLNCINTDGELLWNKPINEWFDDIDVQVNGCLYIWIGSKRNVIREKGKLIWNKPVDMWFDRCVRANDDYTIVYIGEKHCYLRYDGKLYHIEDNKVIEITGSELSDFFNSK